MAEKTETPIVPQHLLSDDESRKWKVVDIAVVSPTSVTALLQNNQEWCIDTFDYDENEYQRSKRICLQTNLKEPPLLLSYVHVENKLKQLVCTKKKLHLIDDESESIEKSVSLSAEPSALCVEDNKVYISTNETKTLMFFKLELPTDTSKIYLKDISEHDSIAEFVVHSKNIYVCTKGGKVSSHNETGEKQHDYRNRKSKNSKARGLAVFTPQGKDSNLLLVTWSDNTLYIYSTKSHHDLLDIDLNVPGKTRITTSCFLMSSEVNDVAVYNMKTVADRGAFKMILVSGSRDEDHSYLYDFVLHDTTTLVQFPQIFLIKRKNLRTLVEMYDSSCITYDNLNAEKEKLKSEIDRSKKEKDDLTEELQNTRSNLSRKEAELSDVKAKFDDARTESDELRRMNEEQEEICCILTKQLEAERKTTEELKNEIDRSKEENGDVTEELDITRSKLSTKETDLSDVKVQLDDARTESDELLRMNEEKEEKCCSLTKQLEAERKTTEEARIEINNLREMDEEKEEKFRSLTKQLEADRQTTEEGGNTKDTVAVSTENMKTKILDLLDEMNDDTNELKKKIYDVMKELESTNSTLEKKEVDRSEIQDELNAAISKKMELQKTAMETDQLKQIIEAKEKEIQGLQLRLKIAETEVKNAKTQVIILQERKNELVNSVTREQKRSVELQGLLSNLEDANNRLKIEHDKAEKKQALFSNILENLDREALILKTESEIVKEILQTKGQQNDMLVCLQIHFDSRIGILRKEEEILDYMMEQQNKTIDFEKKNRRALSNMLDQSSTDEDKQEVTAMGLQHKSLPDNPDTLDKETNTLITKLTGPITQASKPEKQELIGKGPTEEKIHSGATRLPEVEQMLATGKEGVTHMTLFQAEKLLRLEQIQDFKVTKEERQLTMIESQLQSVLDKVKYETLQYEYFRDMFEAHSGSDEYTKTTAHLDANTGCKIKYDKAENTLFFDILDNLERDAFISKTENEILQTEANKNTPIVRLQSEFNSRTGILRKEAELLDYMMEQQNKTIDFEKKNRRALPNMLEQSSTDKDKQEVTAMGLQNKSLPDNPDTLNKEIHSEATRLPEVEQMLATGKEGVTQMTSLQAGKPLRLEQIQDFKVTKEERQLTMIESQLQGVLDKVTYETLQYEYFRDMLESTTKLQEFLQKSTLFNSIDALVKKISNCKDKLTELKENQDNTVKESEVQINWFELSELQVSLVVSQDGGKLKIPGSDVSLDIPPGALREQREIQMKIIPHCLDPGGDPLSFSSNSSVVVELLPNNLQFLRTVHLRLPHCLHLNDNYNSLQDVEVLISHHERGDTPKWDVSTDTACTLQKDHCVIPLKQFCWITYRVDDKIVTAKRLKIFTAGRDMELSDRESEVEVGYFPDLPGSGEILRNNPKLSRGQIKPFLFQKNEEESTLLISLQQVIPTEWQNNIELGDQQIISYHSVCTGTEMSCPFHLQYKPEGTPSGKVPLCLFHVTQKNAERISITFRPEVKCDED